MSWSYSGDPANSDRDAVRFTCGLTDSGDQLIEDEEIDYLLNTFGVISASVRLCRRVATKFARRADQTIGDYSERFNQRAEEYRTLANELQREKSVAGAAGIIAGGISKADKEAQEDDTDRVSPRFERGQFDREGLKSS